jgi:thymidylate kinase
VEKVMQNQVFNSTLGTQQSNTMVSSTAMASFLTRLFDKWNAADIRYLILRNYKELPEHTDNDIDILVEPDNEKKAVKILRGLAGEQNWRIHNIGEYSCKAFYLHHQESLEQLHLDLMFGYKWYSFEFVDHKQLLNARQSLKFFYIPDPSHEAAVNLMTRLIYGGNLKEKYLKSIQQAASEDSKGFTTVLSPWVGTTMADALVGHARNKEWEAIKKQVYGVRRKVIRYNFKRPFCIVASLFSDGLRFLRRWFQPPGISIVFFGPDGCGKTSVADKLKLHMQKTFYPERSIHCHWKPLPQKTGIKPTENPHAKAPRNQLMSLLYFGYHYLPFLCGWRRYIKPVIFRNGLAVIDRYYYDFFVDQRRYRLNLPQWIVRAGFLFVKKPDLVFCLDADPEILQARKAEVSFEECKRQRVAYRALASQLSNASVIDASQELDTVVRDVQKVILDYMTERTKQRFINF